MNRQKTYIGFQDIRNNTFIQYNDPMKCAQSRQHHRIHVLFFCIVRCTEPSLALNAGTIVLDVHPIGASINRGRIARVDTTRAIEFFSQCHNKTIQVLHVGFSILSNGFLQTSVGLICQGMGGRIREEIVPHVGFAVKSVSNAVGVLGNNKREEMLDYLRDETTGSNGKSMTKLFLIRVTYLSKIPGKTCGSEFRTETVAALRSTKSSSFFSNDRMCLLSSIP